MCSYPCLLLSQRQDRSITSATSRPLPFFFPHRPPRHSSSQDRTGLSCTDALFASQIHRFPRSVELAAWTAHACPRSIWIGLSLPSNEGQAYCTVPDSFFSYPPSAFTLSFMRQRRTTRNEKGLDGVYWEGKIPITKTIPIVRLESFHPKLSSGVWKNHLLSLRPRKHVEENLMWKDALLVIFQANRLIR